MVNAYFAGVIAGLNNLDMPALGRLRGIVRDTRTASGIVWLCGNGGSFATAQHWACDLVKVANVRAVVLGSNVALLSAVANDEAYTAVFAQELQSAGRAKDCLIVLSCSGTSPNIRSVIGVAKELHIPSVLLTGTVNGDVVPADHIVRVWSSEYGVIEDCHTTIGHWLTKEMA